MNEECWDLILGIHFREVFILLRVDCIAELTFRQWPEGLNSRCEDATTGSAIQRLTLTLNTLRCSHTYTCKHY